MYFEKKSLEDTLILKFHKIWSFEIVWKMLYEASVECVGYWI